MSLVLLLATTSFLDADTGTASQTFFCLLRTGVLFIALVTVCRRHKNLPLGLMLALPAVVLNWVSAFSDSQLVTVFHNVFVMTFFAFVGFHVLYAVLNDRRVTLDTIRGAVCVYFLTGIGWAYFYETLLSVDPNSFRFTPDAFESAVATHGSAIMDTTYFSFVTLTTLGYGDIAPVTRPARLAACLEAVFGQFYLAVLVARLVALHVKSDP